MNQFFYRISGKVIFTDKVPVTEEPQEVPIATPLSTNTLSGNATKLQNLYH